MAASPLSQVIGQLRRAALLRDGAGMTDGQLLERFLVEREEAAFDALVRRHGPMVMGVCRRVLGNLHDAEDAFQATFLVLVRKAAAIRERELLANWLYGVAYRAALKLKAASVKRRVKEREAAMMPGHAKDDDGDWHDLQPLLDRELSNLHDKYRVAIVLCDLEGKTRKEAARQLGVPEGTLSTRLARGRVMLAKRLCRHGLTLSAGSLAVVLSQDGASAGVPTLLLVSTVKAATLIAAGQAIGSVSTKVVALTEGVLTAMFLSKLKLAAAGLLAAMVLVSATGFIMSQASGPGAQERGSQANDSDAQPRNAAPPAQALGEGHRGTVTASEIGKVYLTNEAQADEDFTGKRIAVTGGMERIKAQDFFSGTDKNSLPIKKRRVYYLEMPWAEYEPGPRLSIPKAPDYAGIIRFHFTEQDRKQLANLRRYQVMTIVGKCIGTDFQEKEGQQILNFDDCKILKAEKPRAHDP